MQFFIIAYLLAKIKPREILFRQNPIKKLNESDYRKQTINSSQSRLSQTWKDTKRKSKSKFRVYLGVKTYEVFLFFSSDYFPWLYCVDSSVASLHSLIYVIREFHRFLHRG